MELPKDQYVKSREDGFVMRSNERRLESLFNLEYMKASARVLLQNDLNKAHAHMTQSGRPGAQKLHGHILEEHAIHPECIHNVPELR
jgi:hypothetical protein